MTDREKAIVMAYTGKCMLTEDKFHIFHEYIEEIMGRPVFTHELADKDVSAEIKEKAKADFIALCGEQEKGKWITKYHGFPPEPTTICSNCGFDRDFNINTRGFGKIKFCPNCGKEMEEK